MATIHVGINGRFVTVDADPQTTLLALLRERLDLTGTKYGCGEGQCGACTVLIDGNPRQSCTVTVGTVGKRQITTIEGLEHDGKLHPLQQAFLDEGAMQCAFCTSGMIIAAAALLAANPTPTEHEIREALDGNLCRCGTHGRVVAAVLRAAAHEDSPQAARQDGEQPVHHGSGQAAR